LSSSLKGVFVPSFIRKNVNFNSNCFNNIEACFRILKILRNGGFYSAHWRFSMKPYEENNFMTYDIQKKKEKQ